MISKGKMKWLLHKANFYYMMAYVLIAIISTIYLNSTKLVPTKYIIILVVVLVLIGFLLYFLLLSKKMRRKKAVRWTGRILSIIMCILILVGGIGSNLYIDSFLNKLNKTEEINKEKVDANEKLDSDVINIALLGIDMDGGEKYGRSDVMKIISLDGDHDKVKITSLQRDNLVYIPYNDTYEKLNHAYFYGGVESSLQALNTNFDLNITQYVSFNFDDVVHIVDILGGVTISMTDAEAATLGVGGAGTYTLNGQQTLTYSRIRKIDSDYSRMQRQNNVINSIISSMKDRGINELLNIVSQVLPYIQTNISNSDIKDYLVSALGYDLGNIEQYQFPKNGYDDIYRTVTVNGYNPNYILNNFVEQVEEIHKNIYEVKSYKVSKKLQDIQDYIMQTYGQ